jgi:hypothetical protein
MREIRLSGSVEGVVSNHDPYSDSTAIVGIAESRAGFGRGKVLLLALR